MDNIIKIILADDHSLLRAGLKSFLEEQTSPKIEIVAEASSGKETIQKISEIPADLLILDLSMPNMGGLETTLELKKNKTTLKILILTQYDETAYLKRVLEAGVDGYILKSARGEELVSAISSIMDGNSYIEPSMAKALSLGSNSQGITDEELFATLTPREQQVLKLIADGLSNKEIAVHLNLAIKTVMVHRANLMEKSGIKNRSKLIQFAIRLGLVQVEEKVSINT